MKRLLFVLSIIAIALSACAGIPGVSQQSDSGTTVTLIADGQTQTLRLSDEPTVADVLRRANVELDDLDRVNPTRYSRVTDGMTITVVDVEEETTVEQTVVPFNSRTVPNDSLPAGEERLLQPGVNGVAEITYRITYEDGVEVSRVEINSVLLEPPQDEVVMIGSQSDLPTVTIEGTLAYISNGNAWMMRQNSANRRALTLDGGLDGKVFNLSDDGERLLFSRAPEETIQDGSSLATTVPTAEPVSEFNSLWVILDTTNPESQPVRLVLDNILFATWVPGSERTILYSTAEPRSDWPGWQANNDLWRAQISANGGLVNQRRLLEPSSGGIYGWYGTTFTFAPDGVTLAWAQPGGIGILEPVYEEPESDEFEINPPQTATPSPQPTIQPVEPGLPEFLLPNAYQRKELTTFAPWNAYDFIWVPTPLWSPDGALVTSVTHGPPLGSESSEDSPIFQLSVYAVDGTYSVNLVPQAGMWAEPRYAPNGALLAYLQANQPLDSTSLSSRYRLMVLDADGSNRRIVYPPVEQPGLKPQVFVWSPDSQQIALVTPGPQGNLTLIDVATGFAQQITADGQSSSPQWTR